MLACDELAKGSLRPSFLFGLLVAMLVLTACESNVSDEEIERMDRVTLRNLS